MIGTDFGKENLINLINHVKADPISVMTVTRAMQAESDLATQVADILHSTEGATPLFLEDISETVDCDTAAT